MDKRVYSEIIINAPAETVWEIITDFENYSEWNKFTPRITLKNKNFKTGAEFDLDCRMTEKEFLKNEHECILEINTGNYSFCMGTSRTKGRPGIRSYRWQICEPVSSDKTRYINHERYEGPLAPIVRFLYDKKLSAAFELFCLALKTRAEEKFAEVNNSYANPDTADQVLSSIK
jgi:hypothetical protein